MIFSVLVTVLVQSLTTHPEDPFSLCLTKNDTHKMNKKKRKGESRCFHSFAETEQYPWPQNEHAHVKNAAHFHVLDFQI